MRKIIHFIVFLAVSSLTACSDQGLLVTAEFSNTQDIKAGTTVFFGQKVVGEVVDVVTTEHGSHVELSLDAALAESINHRAAVVVNRLRQGAPLELHNPPGTVKQSIESGQEIEALDSMMQLLGWSVSGTVAAGTETIAEFKEYLQSEEFQREKAQIGIAIDESVKSVMEGLAEAESSFGDVLSELDLSEQELADVVEQLGGEMQPLVQDLTRSGAELMGALESFADGLESKSMEERKLGLKFLQSLTSALDKLSAQPPSNPEAEAPADKP